jgi:hypothetical protein
VSQTADDYIRLENEEPRTFEFDDMDVYQVPITDPITKKQKMVDRMHLRITLLDGQKTKAYLSFISKRAMETLHELNARGVLLSRPIRITRTGSGFFSRYTFEVL